MAYVRDLRGLDGPQLAKAASGPVRVEPGGVLRKGYVAYPFVLRQEGVEHLFGLVRRGAAWWLRSMEGWWGMRASLCVGPP